MKALVNSKEYQDRVSTGSANLGIDWHFSPPRGSHFGGLWEAGVKSMKHHLKKVLGSMLPTYEELNTVLCQIEGVLNSRPLCPMSSDPSDIRSLTPGHFLIGQPLNALPQHDLTDVPINRLKRFQLVQSLHQHFWSRWRLEYLNNLQSRIKWRKYSKNLKVGDICLLFDEDVPPGKWPLGRVVALYPSKDGNIRVVDVKTENNVLRRPIVKLVLLVDVE